MIIIIDILLTLICGLFVVVLLWVAFAYLWHTFKSLREEERTCLNCKLFQTTDHFYYSHLCDCYSPHNIERKKNVYGQKLFRFKKKPEQINTDGKCLYFKRISFFNLACLDPARSMYDFGG